MFKVEHLFFYEEGEDFNELESTAIRKFAPIFNTSIPSTLKSQGKEPMIMHIAQVFADEENYCTAFESENLKKQAIEAKNNPSPFTQSTNINLQIINILSIESI